MTTVRAEEIFTELMSRLLDVMSAPDHLAMPNLSVTSAGRMIDVTGSLFLVLEAGGSPGESLIQINWDRPITSTEYYIIHPGTYLVLARRTSFVFARTPVGLTGRLTILGGKAK